MRVGPLVGVEDGLHELLSVHAAQLPILQLQLVQV